MEGQRFGRWLVVKYTRSDKWGTRRYLCRCVCGTSREVNGVMLRNGQSKSCGCFQKQRATEVHTTHGHTESPTYHSWHTMMQRCTNTNATGYKHYGGRGIKVHPDWLDFKNFLADMGARPKNKTLDRIDNDGNYEPDNCRWATKVQQRVNQRTQKRNKTGVKGVTLGTCSRYRARITVNGNEIALYHGPSFEEACEARRKAEQHYFSGEMKCL